MKIVFDSSVLVAAFYKPLYGASFSKGVFDYISERESIYISSDILKEVRKAFKEKLKFSIYQTEYFIALLLKKAKFIDSNEITVNIPKETKLRDPNDLHILKLATAGQAELILSWDKDLLSLQQIEGIKILTPREFWDQLR